MKLEKILLIIIQYSIKMVWFIINNVLYLMVEDVKGEWSCISAWIMMNNNVKKDKDIKRGRIEEYVREYKLKLGKQELSQEELNGFVVNYFQSINRSAFYNQMSILNDILKEQGSKVFVDTAKMVNRCVKFNESKYFTRKEIMDICNALENTQDKFIVYAMFSGILGKGCEDLLNIKVEDVAEDYSYIKIRNDKFFCDSFMKELIEDMIENPIYVSFFKADKRIVEFNKQNPYLVKVVPSVRNNNGVDRMTRAVISNRFKKLSNEIKNYGLDFELNAQAIYYSGIMFRMFEKEVNDGVKFTVPTLDNYLKVNGLNVNAIELYRKYNNKYFGVNNLEEV